MSVRIRMKMTGRKHRPFFRICVIDRQKARDGLPIEELGTYDPMVKAKSERVKVNLDRIAVLAVGRGHPQRSRGDAAQEDQEQRLRPAAPRPEAKPKELPAAEAPAEEAAPAEGEAAG